jgi:hypothetical protein
MAGDNQPDDRLQRIGIILGNIFIAALLAFFLYGYVPHFL